MTDTDIVNLALSFVSGNPITALGDVSTNEGKVANANYAAARDYVLVQRAWTFACKRAALVQDVGTPAMDFLYQFVIPSGVVRVIRVTDVNGQPLSSGAWKREGNFILTYELSVYAELLFRVVDTSLFPPAFCLAVAYQLAAQMGMAITENRQLQVDLDAMAQRKLKEAASVDGQQGTSEVITSPRIPGRRF